MVAAVHPSSPERVAQPASGNAWKWALVAAAVGALAVAVYAARMWSSDETHSKIAALEKQIRDKEAADAERERKAAQQAQEEAQQRKARDQSRADEEKARAEAARKPEPSPTPPKKEAPKRREEFLAKSSGVQSSPSVPMPSPQQPASPPKEQSPASAPPTVAEISKPSPTPADRLADAQRALDAQRYTDAVVILKPLADAGDAQAQFRLGEAYAEGHGVDRDAAAAERWYEKAALQGETRAQIKLGAMFATGTGVARNNNLAYVWYGTAARLGANAAKAERDKIGALLQPAEREQADRLIAAKIEGMKRP